ncbi:hypothetical protein KOY_00274 [Bacillus cereus VDM021]|nr:hypothetical protein KOY_00274 [Bacillus cereus VDM021]OOG93412.1 hypothetical protein BTH41_04254 [Bacillus mycoides]
MKDGYFIVSQHEMLKKKKVLLKDSFWELTPESEETLERFSEQTIGGDNMKTEMVRFSDNSLKSGTKENGELIKFMNKLEEELKSLSEQTSSRMARQEERSEEFKALKEKETKKKAEEDYYKAHAEKFNW